MERNEIISHHETEHDHLGWRSEHEDDLEGDPFVKAGVFDADGEDQAAKHHEVRRFHVVHRDFALKIRLNKLWNNGYLSFL